MPLEIISMLASTLLGGWLKMKAQERQDMAAQHKLLIELNSQKEKFTQSARQMQNPSAAWVRRFIVISLMLMAGFILIAPAFFNMPTNVPMESVHGFKLWFLDFTWTEPGYAELTGIVTPEWLPYAILNVMGFYFGTSAVSRR